MTCEMRGHTNFNGVALLFIPLLWSKVFSLGSNQAMVTKYDDFTDSC